MFAEAGASTEEYADLESLYAYKRADAVKSAAVDVTSTLQSLLDDLRYKGDTGLSLRTRETNAAAAFNPLAATVRAGGVVDQDAFADAAKSYLDIERQLYGSTSKYFDKLADITALTGKAITNAGGDDQGRAHRGQRQCGGGVGGERQRGSGGAGDLCADRRTEASGRKRGALHVRRSSAMRWRLGLATSAPQLAVIQPSNADVVAAIQAQIGATEAQTATLQDSFNLMIRSNVASNKLSGGGGVLNDGNAYTLRNA